MDIIVPNVGTEHRPTADKVRYLGDVARAVSARVGPVLCLHGTSSVRPADLPLLPKDGFVKINVYTTLAVSGGQAVTRAILGDVGNIFAEHELQGLVDREVLGQAVLSEGYGSTWLPLGPKLDRVANPPRRDAWFAAVRDRCMQFLEAFNYQAFAS